MPDRHAPIGASALDALALCPGRYQAIQSLPAEERNPSSPAAEDGTRKHALLEQCVRRGCHPSGADAPEGYSDQERAAVAPMWTQYLRAHPARKGGPGTKWLPEQWVEIGKGLGFEEGLFATTIDLLAVYPGTLEIMDAKFGFHPVPPDSLQLKAGAIGALRTLIDDATGQFFPEFRQLKTLKLTILRPSIDKPAVSLEFPIEVVKEWMVEAKEVVRGALAPLAPRAHGEKQCRFCSFGPKCPERAAWQMRSVSSVFGVVEDPIPEKDGSCAVLEGFEILDGFEIVGPEADQPASAETLNLDSLLSVVDDKTTGSVRDMPGEDLGRLLDRVSILRGLIKDVEAEARRRLAAGDPGGWGWKLVAGHNSREYNADETATEEALKKMGLGVKDIYERKLRSPAAMEKLPKVAESKTKREKLGELWHWKPGSPTLAPESDPRPSVSSAANMFDEEET